MLASPKCSLPSKPPHLFFMKRGRKYISKFSKKEDTSENPKSQDSVFPLRVSNVFLARSAIAVLGLGFIDAGYSGDWSRIGAITRETEEMLKVAAYLVAPLSFPHLFYYRHKGRLKFNVRGLLLKMVFYLFIVHLSFSSL